MKLNEILTEKVASIVYYIKPLNALYSILTTNMFPLTSVLDKNVDMNKKYFYLQTYTSRKLALDNKPQSDTFCIIQLNGDKLDQIIKDKNMGYYLNNRNRDIQDKLYSDEPTIVDAKEYIEQISVLVDKNFTPTENVLEILQICKNSNIPLYFFNNENDLISNNRNKKLKIENGLNKQNKNEFKELPNVLKAFIYFYENNTKNSIPTNYQPYLSYLIMKNRNNRFITNLKGALRSDDIKNNPIAVAAISDIMKKEKTNSIETIFNSIAQKWRNLL